VIAVADAIEAQSDTTTNRQLKSAEPNSRANKRSVTTATFDMNAVSADVDRTRRGRERLHNSTNHLSIQRSSRSVSRKEMKSNDPPATEAAARSAAVLGGILAQPRGRIACTAGRCPQ
jgi:hypothetical protein